MIGYCYFSCGNSTFGFDAEVEAWKISVIQAIIKLPKEDGGYYVPSLVYMFPSPESYDRFQEIIKTNFFLNGIVRLSQFYELPDNADIVWTNTENMREYDRLVSKKGE